MIKFNLLKLEKLLKSLYELTHIKASIHDCNQEELLYYPYRRNSFCQALSMNKESEAVCCISNTERFEMAEKEGRPILTICPFGMAEIFAPIIVKGMTVGYIVLGQTVLDGSDLDDMAEKTVKFGFEKEEMKSQLSSLEAVKANILNAAVVVLDACAKYVYTDKYVDVSENELAANIHDYILNHLSDKLTADILCKQFFVSRVTLYKIFENQLKTSVAEFIKNERLKKAKELLQTTSMTIKEISEAVGLEYNYFSKLFYSKEGLTPKKYQMLYRKDRIL